MKITFIRLLPYVLLLLLCGCHDLYDDAVQDKEPVRPRTRSTATTHYYWYRGQQVGIDIDPARSVLVYEAAQKDHILSNVPTPGGTVPAAEPVYLPANLQPLVGGPAAPERLMTIVEHPTVATYSVALAGTDNLYQSPCYQTPEGEPFAVSNLFFVKLNAPEDLVDLQGIAYNTRTTILGNDGWMPLWYVLSCDGQSAGNALEMANYFYETGLFAAAQPDFLCKVESLGTSTLDDRTSPASVVAAVPNDTYFADQWNLHNTGQLPGSIAGVDINYLKARTISEGSPDVSVAVIDKGFYKQNEDINYRDAQQNSTKINMEGSDPRHGTHCAGIIASKTNNGIGLAGVAPLCPLLTKTVINKQYDHYQLITGYVDAFGSVRNMGVSVISCSWYTTFVGSDRLDNAIAKALTEGRNGKGCIVVFAAGNANIDMVNYPARCHPDILAVGSIKSDGTIADDTQWGKELDLVAPGQDIPLAGSNASKVDIGSGTSYACPQVAAVAALILSVKPELTQKEVGEIIVRTARKLPAYNYIKLNSWVNGSRHSQTGHGLLDAYAAVCLAKNDTLPDTRLFGKGITTDRIEWGNNLETETVYVRRGATLTLVPTKRTVMKPGLYVEKGSSLKIVRPPRP